MKYSSFGAKYQKFPKEKNVDSPPCYYSRCSFRVGFSRGPIPAADADGSLSDSCSNWELIKPKYQYLVDNKEQLFELWSAHISHDCFARRNDSIVFGCGIFLNSNNEFVLFFTANGMLLGQFTQSN
jgi:hypothetical protein